MLLTALAMFLVLGGFILAQHFQIGKLEKEITRLRPFEAADAVNQTAVNDCKATAEKNLKQAEEKKALSEQAATRSEKRSQELQTNLEELGEYATRLQRELEGGCPAIDDPAYTDFLCSGPLGCKNT